MIELENKKPENDFRFFLRKNLWFSYQGITIARRNLLYLDC
jgi:hypothetical protein